MNTQQLFRQLARFWARDSRRTTASASELDCIRLEDRILFSASPLGPILDMEPNDSPPDDQENEDATLEIDNLVSARALLVAEWAADHNHGPDVAVNVSEFDDMVMESRVSEASGFTSEASIIGDLSETFLLHSNPGAAHTIFLDFDGHTTSGTAWNTTYTNGDDFVTPAYDVDGDTISFSDQELERIQYIFQFVSEDFIPFDVNVTTEDPGTGALTKDGSGDTDWGIRVVVGGSYTDWYGGAAGGAAKYGSFNFSSDSPAFVFEDNVGTSVKLIAEAITHETGHTLSLGHDGAISPPDTYYDGHGSGPTGWAPIMGNSYSHQLTQWSQGDYPNANNQQDDLAIITTNNGFGYRLDDHGNDVLTASYLALTDAGASATGIIEQNTDLDVFSFATSGGDVNLQIDTIQPGSNLDILAELYDADSNLILSSNPIDLLNADIQTTVDTGMYYLMVTGTGKFDANGYGYSDYGSLGQYFISGSIDATPGTFLDIVDTNAVVAEGDDATTEMVFTVRRTGDLSAAAAVDFSVRGYGNNAADHSDFAGGVAPSGTVSFAAGESSKTISVHVAGDVDAEADEFLTVTISNPGVNAVITTGQAEGVILNDDVPDILDDAAGIHVTPVHGLTTDESGATASFTVTLDRQPTADVVIHVASTDLSEGTTNVDTLRFTNTNWDQSQAVTVIGRDDAEFDGDVTYNIEVSAAQSDDGAYNGLDPDDVVVVNHDNDSQPKVKGKGKGGGNSGGDGDGGKGNGKGNGKGGKNTDVQAAEMLLLTDGDLYAAMQAEGHADNADTPLRRTADMVDFLPEHARDSIAGNEGRLFQRLFAAQFERIEDDDGDDANDDSLGLGEALGAVTELGPIPSRQVF